MKYLNYISVFLFCTILACCTKVKKNVIGEGTGLLAHNRKVNLLFIQSEISLDRFHKNLEVNFGQPIIDSVWKIYKFKKKNWSYDSILLRVESAILIDLKKKESFQMFISAETVNKKDLLVPKTESQLLIKRYLEDLLE